MLLCFTYFIFGNKNVIVVSEFYITLKCMDKKINKNKNIFIVYKKKNIQKKKK